MKQKCGLTGYPSIDKPWLKYYSEEAINAELPECTVYQNIWQHNSEHLGDIALKYFGCKTTYGKLFEQTKLCAKALKTAGVKPGDCVNICSAGVPEAVYLVMACSKIGAIANFLNPSFTTSQMIDRINDTEADLLFVLDKMYSHIADAIDKTCIKRVIIISATGSLPARMRIIAALKDKPDGKLKAAMRNDSKYWEWRAFMKAGAAYGGETEEPYCKDTPVIMVYSSGSTGASKGIVLTNDGVNATIAHYQSPDFPYRRGDTFLQIIPVWFSTGIVLSVLMPICMGVTVITEPIYSKEAFALDVKKYNPNLTLATTSFWVYATRSKEWEKLDLSTMTYPITGGEQVLPRVEAELNTFFTTHGCCSALIIGWGMCELGSTITSSSPNHGKPGSAGFPINKVSVSAFDVYSGRELQYEQRGELRVCSPARMKGYYHNIEATNDYFKMDANGNMWACTGDIGYVDEDGDVFILGRATDSYNASDGTLVYLFDAENVILTNPAVNQCKVVDILVQGQLIPVAHLVLNDGCGQMDEIICNIDKACKKELEAHAVPLAYKCREAFPVHSSGKRDVEVLKRERDGFVDAKGQPVDFDIRNQEAKA